MAGHFKAALQYGLVLALLAAVPFSARAGDTNTDTGRDTRSSLRDPRPLPRTVSIEASPGMSGDVFPALANHLAAETPAQREFSVVQVQLSNPSEAESRLRARVSVRVPGWSDEETQNIELAPGDIRTLRFAPPLSERAFRNREIAPALAQVQAVDAQGNTLYAGTMPLRMRATEDMYWGMDFKQAPYIAAWITPHDPAVEDLLARAKEFMTGRRLPGYESWKDAIGQEESTREQAQAIYQAVQRSGISYVKSSMTFGSAAHGNVSERVRTPHESLQRQSANCIDGVVLFASAFENLGMGTEVVLVPGHAYVGVRVAENSNRYLLLDTALVARVPFDRAVAIAEHGITQWQPAQINHISVSDARAHGIYPMPE